MAPVDLSDTPPSSPTCSPPRKKAKFSLRLKGKTKSKKEQDENEDGNDSGRQKNDNLYPIFRSPAQEIDGNPGMEVVPVLPSHALSGLLNRGNICYANAVLQVLRRCPGFERFVSQLAKDIKMIEDACDNNKDINIEPKYLVTHLSKLLSEMFTYEVDFLNDKENCEHLTCKGPVSVLAAEPHDFMAAFRELYPSFECNLQHDAQEFLCSLIMALQESANEIKKHCNKTPLAPLKKLSTKHNKSIKSSQQDACFIKQLFQGKLVHQTKCLNCEQSKLRYEDIQEVSVPVVEDQPYLDARKKLMLSPTPKKNKSDVHTLQWAISQFASSECLQGDNKYFCENCNTYCEARITTCFDEMPRVLTIHLKRFTSSIGLSSKITSNLQTPLSLSVQEWCSNKCQSKSSVYELFGIVLHSGLTSGSGHYETYIRIPMFEQKNQNGDSTSIPNDDTVLESNGESNSKREAVITNGVKPSINQESDTDHKNIDSNTAHSKKCDVTTTSKSKTSGKDGKKVIDNSVASDSNADTVMEDDTTSTNTVNNIALNANHGNAETKSTAKCDINQNYVEKPEVKSDDSGGLKRPLRRHLRPRKAKKSSIDLTVEESDKHSNVSEEARTQPEDDKAIGNNMSPLNSHGKTSCISLITKYFQKSKKQSSNNSKSDKPEQNSDEKCKRNENGEDCSGKECNSEEQKKPSHRKVNRTIEESFRRISSTKSSNSSTIRKLNFNNDSTEKKESSESDDQDVVDNALSTKKRNCHPEWLMKDWMHFDDCSVDSVPEKDIIDVLSASESSFMSPYLLFYQKSDIIC